MDVITVEDENDIHEIFDRLQMGQPLRDCDKFWNWKKEPLVKYAIELIETKRYDKYMGTSKFSSQKRDRLSDIVGLLSLIMHWNIVTSKNILIIHLNLILSILKSQLSDEFRYRLKIF